MDGSLLELQRTNSHFQFASGARERWGSKPTHSTRLDPCRPSVGCRVFSTPEEFHSETSSSRPSKSCYFASRNLSSRELALTNEKVKYTSSSIWLKVPEKHQKSFLTSSKEMHLFEDIDIPSTCSANALISQSLAWTIKTHPRYGIVKSFPVKYGCFNALGL